MIHLKTSAQRAGFPDNANIIQSWVFLHTVYFAHGGTGCFMVGNLKEVEKH
jgi:hypothetical protein